MTQNPPNPLAHTITYQGSMEGLSTEKQKDAFIEMVDNTVEDMCGLSRFGLKFSTALHSTLKEKAWTQAEVMSVLHRFIDAPGILKSDYQTGTQCTTVGAIVARGFILAARGETEYKPDPYKNGLYGDAHKKFEAMAFAFIHRDNIRKFCTDDPSHNHNVYYTFGAIGEYLANAGIGGTRESIDKVAEKIFDQTIRRAFCAHMNAAYDKLSGAANACKPYVNIEKAPARVLRKPTDYGDGENRFEKACVVWDR